MKNHFKLFISVILLVVTVVSARGQVQASAKIYTKKVRMEDFHNRTVKVVVNDSIPGVMTFRAEVISRWRVSPYEFCTAEEYDRLHSDNDYYFLHFTVQDGIEFLSLDKGGIPKDDDTYRRPFNVLKIPFAREKTYTGIEESLYAAYLDIIQSFAEEAMASDKVGYAGLTRYNQGNLKGKTIYFGPDDISTILKEERENAVAAISIAPAAVSDKMLCYKIAISADTHEVYYYSRDRYRAEVFGEFSKEEIKMFERRNAAIVR